MNLVNAITFMENNPNVKVTMPNHYKSWQYNYYDKSSCKILTETGEEWDIKLSISYNEIDGYDLYEESKK